MEFRIISANENLVKEVQCWLDEEETIFQERKSQRNAFESSDSHLIRGFRCNWDSIVESWREGLTTLEILISREKAVGFVSGHDFLEIHPNERGKGYGRFLGEYIIDKCRDEGRSILEIDIAPACAIDFWKLLGFTIKDETIGKSGGVYAYIDTSPILHQKIGPTASYKINFYTRDSFYSDMTPFVCSEGLGVISDENVISLPKRIICFSPGTRIDQEFFVEVIIDGNSIYSGKTKASEAKDLGFKIDPGKIYYIEEIFPTR